MKLNILEMLVAVLAIAGLYCGYRYYDDVIKPEQQIAAADEEQLALFEQIKPAVALVLKPAEPESSSAEIPELSAEDISAEIPEVPSESGFLSEAEEVNSSVVSWITIPGTHIDYPVVQGEDNDFYLHHGFDGKYNYELGCPFLDYRCNADFSGFNSIVYAHHMTRQRMFADIALYADSSFMELCPVGYLTTENGQHTVRFFAYLNIPSTAAAYRSEFESDAEKQEYIDYILQTAKYKTDDDISTEMHLLLLSTCTFEYEDARGVLVGVIE